MSKSNIEDLPEKLSEESVAGDELTDEELKPVCGGGVSTTPPGGGNLKLNIRVQPAMATNIATKLTQ